MVGKPIVHTGIVNEANGIGGGKFVELDPATGKVVLANAQTKIEALYFTEDIDHGEYVGDDATAVVPRDKEIGICKVMPGMEVAMTMPTAGLTEGTPVVLAEGGLVGAAQAGSGTVIGFARGTVTHNGAAGIAVRIVEPHTASANG